MSNIIEFIFITSKEESFIFPIFIYIVFLIGIIFNIFKHINRIKSYKDQNVLTSEDVEDFEHFLAIPGILMSIGIVGTFYLIYNSLSNFDINEIDRKSVV